MKTMRIFGLATLLGVAAPVMAGEGHGHDGHDMKGHDKGDHGAMAMSGEMFLKKKNVDGYQVSFHVMEAQKGMEHGGSHNFMVKIEHDGHVVTDAKVNSKVIHPNDSSQSNMMMRMGDWYMAGYDLGHAGKHQLLILFKTADGKKHRAGVYYP